METRGVQTDAINGAHIEVQTDTTHTPTKILVARGSQTDTINGSIEDTSTKSMVFREVETGTLKEAKEDSSTNGMIVEKAESKEEQEDEVSPHTSNDNEAIYSNDDNKSNITWSKPGWESLPQDIVIKVLQSTDLQVHDRYHAALTCKAWLACLHVGSLWHTYTFQIYDDYKFIDLQKVLDYHATHLRNITMEIDQKNGEARKDACKIIEMLSTTDRRRLEYFKICFINENPIFYGGHEFMTVLRHLFGATEECVEPPAICLKHVNLELLSFAFNADMIDMLAEYNRNLVSLNVQNNSLICKLTPSCILNLVKKCRKLKHLAVHYTSMSDEVLLALAEQDRVPIESISVQARREDHITKDWTPESWQQLLHRSPKLDVILEFDETCPQDKINTILIPNIPVRELRFKNYSTIHEQVKIASIYYSGTLETVILYTTLYTQCLGQALVAMAKSCKNIKCMKVNCHLTQHIHDQILALLPEMRISGKYQLVWSEGAEHHYDWAVDDIDNL